jgi:glutamate/tyrosine decarboxylase-like PLP-dependent enzyme
VTALQSDRTVLRTADHEQLLGDLPDVDHEKLLTAANQLACDFVAGVNQRHVAADTGTAATARLIAELGGALPDSGENPFELLHRVANLAPDHVVASRGGGFGGFVVGGCHPVAEAFDRLLAAWDPFAATHVAAPLVAMAERIALRWLIDLIDLDQVPHRSITGAFVQGTTEGNTVSLAAARHRMLAEQGWDVEERGMFGAPPVPVLIGADAHRSVEAALQTLGFGRGQARRVATDDLGRMLPAALERELRHCGRPAIVCAMAGNIDTGAFDPLRQIATLTRQAGGWCHIDGAFGLPTAASPRLAHLVDGAHLANSWAFDMHKSVVGYDCGVVLATDPEALAAAVSTDAAYTTIGPHVDEHTRYDPMNGTLGMARRGRGFPAYGALAALGRSGMAVVMDRLHRNATRLAEQLDGYDGIRIPTKVIFNQVLIDPEPAERGAAERSIRIQSIIEEIARDGTCWVGGTEWRGRRMLRYSFANYVTTDNQVNEIAGAIRRAARRVPMAH